MNPFAKRGTEPFRGLGHNVRGLREIADIKTTAKLDWKVVPMPVLIQGKTENRLAENWQALVRSDNGAILDVPTKDYHVTQNGELLQVFRDVLDKSEAEMMVAGSLDGGRKVFAAAEMLGQFEFTNPEFKNRYGVEDRTRLHLMVTSGHARGTANQVWAVATRLICWNGARITEQAFIVKWTHQKKMTADVFAKVQRMIQDARLKFGRFEQNCKTLYGFKIDPKEEQAVVIQLLQPALLKQIVEKHQLGASNEQRTMFNAYMDNPNPNPKASRDELLANGQRIIDQILSRESRLLDPADFNRPVRAVIEGIPTQPGVESGRGTAYQTYNGVTHWVDNVRGRNADTGVQAAIFGEGDALKANAMTVLLDRVAAHRN